MPTYEYQCKTCGSVMDIFQSITATPLRKTRCEKCGEDRPVRRLIGTGGGLIFKGSGFYQTDYRGDSYEKAKKADADGAKATPDAATKTPSTASETTKSDSSSPSGESSPKPAAASKSRKKSRS